MSCHGRFDIPVNGNDIGPGRGILGKAKDAKRGKKNSGYKSFQY
jgi:hypothetical protein